MTDVSTTDHARARRSRTSTIAAEDGGAADEAALGAWIPLSGGTRLQGGWCVAAEEARVRSCAGPGQCLNGCGPRARSLLLVARRAQMQQDQVTVVSHLQAHSWGRSSAPATVDKPSTWRSGGVYLGRKLHGKPALQQEVQAAIRLQRMMRGCQQRTRMREQALGVRRLHGGLQYLPLPSIVALAHATRTDPRARECVHVEQIDTKIAAFETLHGKLFPGLEPGLRHSIMRYLRLTSYVEGENMRKACEHGSLEDMLIVVLSGSVGVPGVQKRVLHRHANGGAWLQQVVSKTATVVARVSETFGGLLFNEQTRMIERTSPLQGTKDAAHVTALTDCVCATLSWQDWVLTTGDLTKLTVQVLRKSPSKRSRADTQLLLNSFQKVDMVAGLSFAPMREQLCNQCRHRRVHNGEVLFRQGDNAESCFIVVQGHVRVVIDGESMTVLGPGESFGQHGVLGLTRSSRKRTATVIGGCAKHDERRTRNRISFCDLAEITRSTYIRAVQGSVEQVESILRKKPSQRQKNELEVLAQLFAHTTFFQAQLKSSLVQLKCCRVLKMRQLLNRQTLFSQGEHGNEFFIVMQGSLVGEIAVTANSPVKTFRLGPGDSFGELSVTGQTEEDRRRTASITCGAQDCLLAVLSREDYLHVTGRLESAAMAALRKAVPADPGNIAPTERTESDTKVIWSYLKELPFFSDLQYPYLQQAVCSHLEMKTMPAGSKLTEAGQCYPGCIYFLLRGGIDVLAARTNRLVETYWPVTHFVDTPYALHPDSPGRTETTKVPHMEHLGRADRTLVSVDSQPKAKSKFLYVSNFPADATAVQLRDRFAEFDLDTCIVSVQIWKTGLVCSDCVVSPETSLTDYPRRQTLWAAIEFCDSRDLMLAELDGVRIVMQGYHTVNPADVATAAGANDEESRTSEFVLSVESSFEVLPPKQVDTRQLNSTLLDSWPSEDQTHKPRGQSDEGTVLAVLSRDDYLQNTVNFIQGIIRILQKDVSKRTVEELDKLDHMFDNTPIFAMLNSSARSSCMLRRNICRYVGCQIVNSKTKGLPTKGQAGKRMLVVLAGELHLDFGDKTEKILTAGHAFGHDLVVAGTENSLYTATVTCRDSAVLADLHKDDYIRAANTDGMQRMIDQFWALGVACSKNEESEQLNDAKAGGKTEEAARAEHQEQQREWEQQESNAKDIDAEPVLNFKGYRELYPRIAKVLAPKEAFSMKDRKRMLEQEWKRDKAQFGSTDRDFLLKEEFGKSIYELIDVWCHGVESVELFEKLLEIIHENITVPVAKIDRTKSTQTKAACHDAVELRLKPMKAITCSYQQLMDKRFEMSKKVKSMQSTSSLSRDQLTGNRKKQKLNLAKLVETKSIVGAAGVQSARTSKELIQHYKAIFDSIDTDGSGRIDRKELQTLTTQIGREMSDEELDAAMIEMDVDRSGVIEFDEFLAWFSDCVEHDQLMRDAFDAADFDGSGTLDQTEMLQVLRDLGQTKVTQAELEVLMEEMNLSGEVTLEDFRALWNRLMALEVLRLGGGSNSRETYVRQQFDSADSDGSGAIDRSELSHLLDNLGRPLAEPEQQLAFALMDEDNSGNIEWREFKKWLEWLEKDDVFLCKVFSAVDTDGSGTLDRENIKWVLSVLSDWREVTTIDVDDALASMDCDDSGEVDYEEFNNWWTRYCLEIGKHIKELYNKTNNDKTKSFRADLDKQQNCDRNLSTSTESDAVQIIQRAWRQRAWRSTQMQKSNAAKCLELAGKEYKLAQHGDWRRGRSRVILDTQMSDSLTPSLGLSAHQCGAEAAIAVDKLIVRMIENAVSAIDLGGVELVKLWELCRLQCINTFGLDEGEHKELQVLMSALRALSVKDVYRAIDTQRSNETAKLWEVVYTFADEQSSTERIKTLEHAARLQLLQHTPVRVDNFEGQLSATDLGELKTMSARLAALMDDQIWNKPGVLDVQAEVLALDLCLHMVETELRTHQAGALPVTVIEEGTDEIVPTTSTTQPAPSQNQTVALKAELKARLDVSEHASGVNENSASSKTGDLDPGSNTEIVLRSQWYKKTRGFDSAVPQRWPPANWASQVVQYHDDGTVSSRPTPVPPKSCSNASDGTVLSFTSVTAVEERAKGSHRYGLRARPGSGRVAMPSIVPTFELLALLGKRAEEQNGIRVKTPGLHGLTNERVRWKDDPAAYVDTSSRHAEAAPILQPGTSVVAPLTKAQQRRLRKADHGAWKSRHVQPGRPTPYDYRTSIGGTNMVPPMPRQPHATSYSARGVAGEAGSMERRGTVAAARLGTGNSYMSRAVQHFADAQAAAAIRNLRKLSAAEEQEHQQMEQQDGQCRQRRFVPTRKNKIYGPIRAPSPSRLPLPTPRHTASPVRGLLDVFPDGTQIQKRLHR